MGLVDKYGPWAIVAGASEGTGRAFALQLAAGGIACVLIARREQPLLDLAAEIRARHGLECLALALDLSTPEACDRIIEVVGSREVGLYISNAGADPNSARFLERDVSTWVSLVSRNVLTTMRCCHHFAQLMQKRGRGGILLVGSGACYGGGSNLAAYSACKAFDLCFAESIWAELRSSGIDVLYLALTMTDTPALRQLLAGNGLPVPERLASAEDVARAGLEHLPAGPVHNFGQDDSDAGFAPSSPDARRARILMIDEKSGAVFGKNSH
ncbi:MAG: SDR family NAD(P)-dependent oxidoreductase [Gammaproteobacteria bacterium]|nr:SDR family NAD(P)-dependent oxidoreductase [Gammaproteobacteria bacterium]